MRTKTFFLILLLTSVKTFAQTPFQKDFSYYWQSIHDNFAYFDRQHTNWEKVSAIYQPMADTISSRDALIHLLEKVNNELYNGHVFLNTNTNSSNRIIPSGADLKVSKSGEQFIISEIRKGCSADACGLQTGMQIIQFNGIPVMQAIQPFLPRSIKVYTTEIYDYAANMLLAGTHDTKRIITVMVNGNLKIFNPDSIVNKTENRDESLLTTEILKGNIGYIKINNSLGEDRLITAFDLALDSLIHTTGLILDLRETPGGGTTTVARAIMGRFTGKEMPYQKHIYTIEEKETGIKRSTLELVSPRGKFYNKPLIVLVGYWTASMGEGMAIGFDGMKRAKVMGTKMAGLLGEIETFEMPESKIHFSFPVVKLQHVNGRAREDFIPVVAVSSQTRIVERAADMIRKKK